MEAASWTLALTFLQCMLPQAGLHVRMLVPIAVTGPQPVCSHCQCFARSECRRVRPRSMTTPLWQQWKVLR